MNILQRFAAQVRTRPRQPAIISPQRTIGYGQLALLVGSMAHHLLAQGVKRGDVVATSRLGSEQHVIAMMALSYVGAVSVGIGVAYSPQAKEAAARKHRVRFWLHGPTESWAGIEGLRKITIESVSRRQPEGTRPPNMADVEPGHPLRILMSSGTTGQNKGILWTHGQRGMLETRVLEFLPGGPGERLFVQGDVGAGYAYSPMMSQLASGGAVLVPLLGTDDEFFEFAAAARPTRAIAPTSSAFAFAEYARKHRDGQGPIPGLITLSLAGAAVPPALLASLEERVCPNVVTIYGATEVGTIARDDIASHLQHPGSAGRLLPGVKAEAVDEDGQALPAGETGMLRYRGAGMASGYDGDEAATAAAFRGGWFYPGDRGAIVARHVMLAGRDDDRINLDGNKVDPAAIERIVNAQPGVLESAAIAMLKNELGSKLLAIAIVADRPAKPDLKAIGRQVHEEARVAGRYVVVDSLPRTPAGKLDRRSLARKLAAKPRPNAKPGT